ncbi:MAG: hypothetical protein WCO13_04930 [Bacteroidota bacterium]
MTGGFIATDSLMTAILFGKPEFKAVICILFKTKNMNDNANEDYSLEMEEHNLLLHDKSEAFKKLAKALYDKSQHRLNPHPNDDGETNKNKAETKLNK